MDVLEDMAKLIEELDCVLWSVFFLVPIGRDKEKDMISPAQHEKVFHWLYRLSKMISYDIKTTPIAEIYQNSSVFQDPRNPDKYKGKCGVCEF